MMTTQRQQRIVSIRFLLCTILLISSYVQGFSVQPMQQQSYYSSSTTTTTTTQLQMVDNNVIMGAGIGIAGLVAGIGLVAFTEQQGERAKERGSGLSDTMSTRITGQLMEDVEVSSVDDLDSLTSQLENALKKAGGINKDNEQQVLEFTEEEIQKKIEANDDGW
jgi:hypothetical protein